MAGDGAAGAAGKDTDMRWWLLQLVAVTAGLGWTTMTTPLAIAQETPAPDELKKMYDDALVQLKAAQDRKNELGIENEQLKARVADLEQKLTASKADSEALQAEVNSAADRTYFLRSYYAAWQRFLERYPHLKTQWDVFLERGPLTAPHELPEFSQPADWLSAKG
jgi:septal ring factor EnvC (AmiA/AmiB activator)